MTPHTETPDTSAQTATAESFSIEAARLLSDSHCEDVLVFDVRGISQLTDYLVLATGTSDRQIKAVGTAARLELEELLERRVHLFLRVKVSPKWIDDPARYRDLGLEYPR